MYEWSDQGRCRNLTWLFCPDPDLPDAERAEYLDRAKEICKTGCPVKQQCLEHALQSKTGEFGVWGGTDERERRKIRKAARKGTKKVVVRPPNWG